MTREDAGGKKKGRERKSVNKEKEKIKNARKNGKGNPRNTRCMEIRPTAPPPDSATDAHPATSLLKINMASHTSNQLHYQPFATENYNSNLVLCAGPKNICETMNSVSLHSD
jgi:hypothetical protein